MSYSKRGTAALRGGQPVVGWTTPSVTYDKMRRTDVVATAFDGDVRVYVTDPTFKAAWQRWFATWKEWFDKTLSTSAKLSTNIWNSDEIAQQAEAFNQDLARFQATYAKLTTPDGKPLPSNAPLTPLTPVPPGEQKKEDEGGIPLWVFLVGAGLIGLGVYTYIRVKKTAEMVGRRAEVIEKKVLPVVMTSTMGPSMGPAFAEAAATRDPELSISEQPRPYVKYLLSSE